MIKSTVAKVMCVGKTTVFIVGLAVVLALMFGVATAALAAVPGSPFRLGQINMNNRLSTLVGSVNSSMLRVDNNSAGSSATALELRVEPGKAPMKVNSDKLVTSFNADKLDGKTANDFYYFGEKVQDSFNADFASSAGEAQNAQIAGDADTLDGQEPAEIGRELFAVVRSDGTLARGNGATSVGRWHSPLPGGTLPGAYRVFFDRDVGGCASVATIASPEPTLFPPTGQISLSNGGNEVSVSTTNSDGLGADKPFHLAVLC